MRLTVYRQATSEREDGTIVYKGEDAHPYVGDSLFFVADGLGGTSAIRHQKFNKDMFDEDKLLDVLYSGVYDNYHDDEFVAYVLKSFSEFLAVKHCYFDKVANIKKSGYFASRLVSSILLREMKDSEENKKLFVDGEIFDKIAAAEDEDARASILKEVGDRFHDAIRTKLIAISKNANLVYEGSFSGLSLLATTLCATIYREREDSVDALYLVAGDCKPFLWSREGLYQMVADQEGADGGMTNYICANEDKDFFVECIYKKFDKPCILFNASDGCFDSAHFFSPIAYEKVLLDAIVSSEGMDGVKEKLEAFFIENGTHDDSSTMALRAFGYADFAALRADAEARLAVLDEQYTSQLEGVLDRNYAVELDRAKNMVANYDTRLPAILLRNDAVLDWARTEIVKGGYAPYDEAMAALAERESELSGSLNESKVKILDVIDRHFIPIAERLGLDCVTEAQAKRAARLSEDFEDSILAFNGKVSAYIDSLDEVTDLIQREFDSLSDMDRCWDYGSYLSCDFEEVAKAKDKLLDAMAFIETLEKRNNTAVKDMNDIIDEFYTMCRKAAAESAEGRERALEAVLDGEVDLTAVYLVNDGNAEQTAEAIDSYRAALSEVEGTLGGERASIVEKNLRGFVTERAEDIRRGVLSGAYEIDVELKEALEFVERMKNGGIAELEERAARQPELIAPYNEEHMKYIKKAEDK